MNDVFLYLSSHAFARSWSSEGIKKNGFPIYPKCCILSWCQEKLNFLFLLGIWLSLFSLKLPSLFAAWFFWTIHNKSHNMKALVILSHSWSPLHVYIDTNGLLYVSVRPPEYFREAKNYLSSPMQITWQWRPVSRFSHGLITLRQNKTWT